MALSTLFPCAEIICAFATLWIETSMYRKLLQWEHLDFVNSLQYIIIRSVHIRSLSNTPWHLPSLTNGLRLPTSNLTFRMMECDGEGQQQFNRPTEQMGLYTKVDWLTDRRSSRDFDCDWRSVGQPVLVSSPIWGQRPNCSYCQTVTGLFVCVAHSDKRSHYWVRVPRDQEQIFSQIRDSPNQKGHVLVFVCLRNRAAQLCTPPHTHTHTHTHTHAHSVPFSSPPNIHRVKVEIFEISSTV
jgi:hypothetical protein